MGHVMRHLLRHLKTINKTCIETFFETYIETCTGILTNSLKPLFLSVEDKVRNLHVSCETDDDCKRSEVCMSWKYDPALEFAGYKLKLILEVLLNLFI